MLSRPEYEWELQWINPNGNRLAYPIYVNENPEAFLTPDGRHVCVCYSASGIWTIYHVLGMLTAPANTNLLDSTVWTKSSEPLFTSASFPAGGGTTTDNEAVTPTAAADFPTGLFGTSNICLITDAETSKIITSTDGRETPMLYEGTQIIEDKEVRSIYLGAVHWNDEGLPDFGRPCND